MKAGGAVRTILHLSDLHFGRIDQALVHGLVQFAATLKPDLVAISGDLTQRARRREFEAARSFLDRLPGARIVVPGNHDVPLYDVLTRFLAPLGRFRRFISEDEMPLYDGGDVAVVGITSARSFTVRGGRLPRSRVSQLAAALARVRPDAVRVLVSHHPVDFAAARGFGGSRPGHVALPEAANLGIEIVLSGHLHTPGADAGSIMIEGARRHLLLITAGTATSVRRRGGEPNSFNVIRIARPDVVVERHDWSGTAFRTARAVTFHHGADGWTPDGAAQKFT